MITIYCDGACSPNPGTGGWAAIIIHEDGTIKKYWGWAPNTTNSRMEITAMWKGLAKVDTGYPVQVISDSQFAVRVAMGIYQAKANIDLWEQVAYEIERLGGLSLVRFYWTPGHSGQLYNEMADMLAVSARVNQMEGEE